MKNRFESFSTSLEEVMRQGSDCGDQYARLDENYIFSQRDQIKSQVQPTFALVWTSMGVYLLEVAIALLVLLCIAAESCRSRMLTCSEWKEEFSDVFKYFKFFN